MKDLDIEKIKSDAQKWSNTTFTQDEIALYSGPGGDFIVAYYAGYKAALEAYDPDAIRREERAKCAQAVVDFYTDQDLVFQEEIDFFNKRIRSSLEAAIERGEGGAK